MTDERTEDRGGRKKHKVLVAEFDVPDYVVAVAPGACLATLSVFFLPPGLGIVNADRTRIEERDA